ncbi:MAG: hypothetical protein IKZ49_04095 [Alphaproteobacteria bacterium]|nr:hypothetical protein [Alphaproteobacteria bacterium]
MAEIKVDIRNDEKFAKFIYGIFKTLATNKKVKLNVEYCSQGLEWSKITGVLGNGQFVIEPEYIKNSGSSRTIYHLHVAGYEVEFEQEYSLNLINGKLTKIVLGLQDRIRENYILDENTKVYFPRPKQPNWFQRVFGSRVKE